MQNKKIFLLISCMALMGSIFSQTKFSNIEFYQENNFPIKDYYTCSRIAADGINCVSYECDGNAVEIAFANCAPDAEEEMKQTTIGLISAEVEKIITTSNCKTKDFYLLVGEGVFITPADKLEGNAYLKKAWKLNLGRFIEKFGKQLSEAFPKNKIYVVEWGW